MKRLLAGAFAFAIALLCLASANAGKVTIVQETPWQLNGQPCGNQAQCQQAAIAAAQADPGVFQSVAGPTWLVTAPASGGSTGNSACPNIGAMQPADIGSSGGPPVFADPCHSQ